MTDDANLQPAVAAEFLALADLLEGAADAQWDTPSLCAGWRVREVVAHMTMAARYSEEQFMTELRRCGLDFGRLSNELAARDAELPPGELLAGLRSEVMQHWTPPGGGWHGALNHVVIHGLDVTVALGVPRRRHPDRAHRHGEAGPPPPAGKQSHPAPHARAVGAGLLGLVHAMRGAASCPTASAPCASQYW